ncbi:MAG TPA: hypothetical protein VF746_27415 [Longimicrobium sp.]|jgi:hypothetical protein
MKKTLLAAALLLLSACSDTTQPPLAGVLVTMTGNSFGRNSTTGIATVPYVVFNSTGAIIAVPICSQRVAAVVERRNGATWEVVDSPTCEEAPGSVPAQLQPGSRLSSEALLDVPGHYRLRIPFTASGQTVQLESVSPEFDVG